MLVSMFVCAVTGVLVEIVAYRRLRKLGSNRLTTLISAIGVSIVLSETVRIVTSSAPANNPRLLDKIYLISYPGTTWNVFGLSIPISAFEVRLDTLLVIVFAIILLFIVDTFVQKTRLGKGIRAVSMSEQNAQLMGVNLNKVISSTFFIAGLMTGAASFFYVTVYESTKFNVGFELGLAAFTAAVLGGIGNIRGAFFGGIALGILEIYAATVFGTQWKAVTAFIVLVLVLLFKPNGLFGESLQQARV
jgi:branched-chain amino acid transport system permease protein